MPALQEFHDSTLYLIRAETAVTYILNPLVACGEVGFLYLNLVGWFEVRKPNIYELLLGCPLTQSTKTPNRTVLTSILNSSQLNCEKKEII